MKKLRCLFTAFALALFVSISAFAGEMPGVGVAPPPPDPPEVTLLASPNTSGQTSQGDLELIAEAQRLLLELLTSIF